MPFLLVLAALATPYWLCFLLLHRLFRARVLTVARLLALAPLGLLAFADFVLTPVLWLLPQTLWPPLRPALTWGQLFARLSHPAGITAYGGPANLWWRVAVELLHTRPWPGWALTQIPFILAAVGVLSWAWRSGWPARRGQPLAAATATHGATRWRKAGEMAGTLARVACDRPGAPGVVIGADGGTAWVTRRGAGNEHVLLVGPSRRGKTRRTVLPTIWTLGHHAESLIVGDPKGELHAMTAGWLRSRGYQVTQLDLLRPGRGGGRWNPLAAVAAAHARGDDEEASRLAWGIGNVLAWSAGSVGDPIWPQAEESLISALCLAVALEAPEDCRHMATAYRLLTDLGRQVQGASPLDGYFRSLPPAHPARLAYGTASLSEDRTRASIFTGTAAHLRLWGDPGVAWLCGASSHDPADAGRADRPPQAIFLLLPDEARERWPIAALYVHLAYAALAAVARENGGRLGRRCWFLLDEFGNLPKVPDMGEKLTVSAGRGVHFLLAVQSLAQLGKYGQDVRAVIEGNCDTKLVLGTSDEATARSISALCGTYTVRTQSLQRRVGATVGGTEAATGRPLLTVDEALRWPVGAALVLQSGQYPARLPLADLSAWTAAHRALVPEPSAAAVPVAPPPTWCPEVAALASSPAPTAPPPVPPEPAPRTRPAFDRGR